MAKNQHFATSSHDTVIGSSVKLKGNLVSEGDITVDGRMAGNIKSGGHVTIGINAHVNGDINADSVTVIGHLEGNIKSSDITALAESGQVYGDIKTGRIEIALGAIFIGQSTMKPPTAKELADHPGTEQPSAKS